MPKGKYNEMVIPFLEEKANEQRRDQFTPEIIDMVVKYYGKVSLPTLLQGINEHFNKKFTLPQLNHLLYDRLRGQLDMMRPNRRKQ